MTHTYAVLEVRPSTYEDVRKRLERAGYGHAFHDDGCIDMHGIGLQAIQLPEPPPLAGASTMKSFKHYQGGTYTLLMVARNSEQREELLAVYVSHQTQQIWVRPWLMFNEPIQWPDGVTRPRFVEMTSNDLAAAP